MPALRIGTRGSALALWQANYVANRLRPVAMQRPVELIEIQTSGDQIRDLPLNRIGGDGVFTREIQRALLDRVVDVAVHSLKDLPTAAVPGLVLAAVPPRGPAGDALISRRHPRFDALPQGAVVATSSLRRRAQVLDRRPDLRLVDIRGNVETRLRKLHEEQLDALILAQAGLERLELAHEITERLHPGWMLPAVGQGALGLECRADDRETVALLARLNDQPTRQMVLAERALLRELGGGCLLPIGVASRATADSVTLEAAVLHPEGKARLDGQVSGPVMEAEEVGRQLATDLLGRGAGALLAIARPG
jgi:hydroxymethylbilane synthase